MANISITVTDNAGTIVYNAVHASRYTVASLVNQVRTKVSYSLRVDVDTLIGEGFEIGNAANNARVGGATFTPAPSAPGDEY